MIKRIVSFLKTGIFILVFIITVVTAFADNANFIDVKDDNSFIYNQARLPDIKTLKTNLREALINNDSSAIYHNSILISSGYIFDKNADSSRLYLDLAHRYKSHLKHNHYFLLLLEFDLDVLQGNYSKEIKSIKSLIYGGFSYKSDVLYRKGILEELNKNYSKAYQYFLDALKTSNNQDLASLIYFHLAEINFLTGNFKTGLVPSGENYLHDLGRISANLDFKSIKDSNKASSNKLRLALSFTQKSLTIAGKNSNLSLKRDIYEFLSKIYTNIGESDIALKYHKLFSEINNQLIGTRNSRNIADLQDKYIAEKQKKEIESKQKEIALKNLKEIQLRTLVYLLSAVSLIVILIAAFFIISNHLKKKTNDLLEANNNMLKETNNQLLISENNYREANNAKLKLFSIIAQDLRYPINDLLGITQFLNSRYDFLEPELVQETLKDLNNSTRKIHNLMENLLYWSESQLGIMKFYKEELSPSELVEHNIFIFRTLLERKGLSVRNNINPDFRIYADMESLLTVMKNLISNSIKYSNEGGQIIVDAKISGKNLQMIFQDFGKGIPQEEINHIFRIDLHKGGIGNNNLEGSGLGLVLCRELIEKNNGSIRIESTVGTGTKVFIELPLLGIRQEPSHKLATID